MNAMASSKLTLKLLINTKSFKLLYAEADATFVDFSFSIMALPIGIVSRLLKENEGFVGSLGTLYGSIGRLDVSYFKSYQAKYVLLNPKVNAKSLSDAAFNIPILTDTDVVYISKLYRCSQCTSSYVTDCPDIMWCSCDKGKLSMMILCVRNRCSSSENHVKQAVAFMVMDDLSVKPMSSISSINILYSLSTKDLASVEEKTVSLGQPEALELLKASFHSKTVLTDVFLRQNDKFKPVE